MIKITNYPEMSYRRSVTIYGTRGPETPVSVVLSPNTGTVNVFYTGPTTWGATLTLLPGSYNVQAGEPWAQEAQHSVYIQVKAMLPVKENLITNLDRKGKITGISRDIGETLGDYRDVLLDSFYRPGSRDRKGSIRNLQRALRVRPQQAVVVETIVRDTVIEATDQDIRWTCSAYIAEEVVPKSSRQLSKPLHQVLREEDYPGDNIRIKYTYWKSIPLFGNTVKDLVLLGNDACKHSGFSGTLGQGTCNAGISREGWPDRFFDNVGNSYLPCANGSCSRYEARDPYVTFKPVSVEALAYPLHTLVHDAEWSAASESSWETLLVSSPVTVHSILDTKVRKWLLGSKYDGSSLSRISDRMQQVFKNLWGSADENTAIASNLGSIKFDPLIPDIRDPGRADQNLFESGTDPVLGVKPRIRESGGKWYLDLEPGYLWSGANKYYFYADKKAVSLADCAVLEVSLNKTELGFADLGRSAVDSVVFESVLSVAFDPLKPILIAKWGAASFFLGYVVDEFRLYRELNGEVSHVVIDVTEPRSLQATSHEHVYLAADSSLFSLTMDGGEDEIGVAFNPNCVSYRSNHILLAGVGGNVSWYDGTTWGDTELAGLEDLYACWISEDMTAWVAGDGGAIYYRDGTGWHSYEAAAKISTIFPYASPVDFKHISNNVMTGDLGNATAVYTYEQNHSAARIVVGAASPEQAWVRLVLFGSEFYMHATSSSYPVDFTGDPATIATQLEGLLASVAYVERDGNEITITPKMKEAGESSGFSIMSGGGVVSEEIYAAAWVLDKIIPETDLVLFDHYLLGNDSLWIKDRGWYLEDFSPDKEIFAPTLAGQFVYSSGVVYRAVPAMEINIGTGEQVPVVHASIGGVKIPSSNIETLPGKIRLYLGPVLNSNPGMWENLRGDDNLEIQVTAPSGGTIAALDLRLVDLALNYRLPSKPIGSAPVIATNNSITEDLANPDKTDFFVKEQFYVDSDNWIHFDKAESLVPNSGFEDIDARGVPVSWVFEDELGTSRLPDNLISAVSESFRGGSAVAINGSYGQRVLSTLIEIPTDRNDFTLSLAAKSANLDAPNVITSSQLIVKILPTIEGSIVDWPAEDYTGEHIVTLTNKWSLYRVVFGRKFRRLPENADGIKIEIRAVNPSASISSVIDNVQLAVGVEVSNIDRTYSYGDDLTIEYEGGSGYYETGIDINPASLPANSVIGVIDEPTYRVIDNIVTRIDDYSPYYDETLLAGPEPVNKDKTRHRASVGYALLTGPHKLMWSGQFIDMGDIEVIELEDTPPPSKTTLTVVGPTRKRCVRGGGDVVILLKVRDYLGHPIKDKEVTLSLDGLGSLSSNKVVSDSSGIVRINYTPPPELEYRFLQLSSDGSAVYSYEDLVDRFGNSAPAGRIERQDYHNMFLGKVVNAAGAPITSTPLYIMLDDTEQMAEVSYSLGLPQEMNHEGSFVSNSVQVDDLVWSYKIDPTETIENSRAAVQGSLRLSINGKNYAPVSRIELLYERVDSFFVDYGVKTTIYYRKPSTVDSVALKYLQRAVFTTQPDGTQLPENVFRIDAGKINVGDTAYLQIVPDIVDTITVEVEDDSAATLQVEVLHSSVSKIEEAYSEFSPRNLKIAFDQETVIANVPQGASKPLPSSGDSLRVSLSWDPPETLTGVSGYLFYWQANGPTGPYNEYPPSTIGPDQAGTHKDPLLLWDGEWTYSNTRDLVAEDASSRYRCIVRWPTHPMLDPTLNSGAVGNNILMPWAGAYVAGQTVVWEGGGIDKATYTLSVHSIGTDGRVLGSATVQAVSPNLTPPAPPKVFPSSVEREFFIEVPAGREVVIRKDHPSYGSVFKDLLAYGVVRIEWASGVIEQYAANEPNYRADATVRVGSSLYILGAATGGLGAFSTVDAALFHARGQFVIVGAEDKMVVSAPEGRGKIQLKVSYPADWVKQLPSLEPRAIVQWLATEQASNKEILI